MKTISLFWKIFLLAAIFMIGNGTIKAEIWVHALMPADLGTVYVGTPLSTTSWNGWFNFEHNYKDNWNASEVGYGQNPDGVSEWNWSSADCFNCGEGHSGNSLVHRNLGSVQLAEAGTYYIVGRAKGQASDNYVYATQEWTSSAVTFSTDICSYLTVLALQNPTALTAEPTSEFSIAISATEWLDRKILIVRYPHNAVVTVPVNGTEYSTGDNLGEGKVVFIGFGDGNTDADVATFTDNGLTDETTYDYYFYSENYKHYSDGAMVSARTNAITPWFGDSYMRVGENWYTGSQTGGNSAYVGADLGIFKEDFTFESGIFVYPKENTTATVTLHYSIDNGTPVNVPMTFVAEDNNNARYETGSQNIAVAGLAYSEHSLKIRYTVAGIVNSTEEAGYIATFTVSPLTALPDISGNPEIKSVEIYTISGQFIRSVTAENGFLQKVQPGAYLLRINGTTHKLIVR